MAVDAHYFLKIFIKWMKMKLVNFGIFERNGNWLKLLVFDSIDGIFWILIENIGEPLTRGMSKMRNFELFGNDLADIMNPFSLLEMIFLPLNLMIQIVF